MRKVMIVEDDPKISAYLKSYIAKYNFDVIEVVDFENLLHVFIAEQPDLVLLDINLPYYDGFYWCRQIRQHSICPVIFVSARIGEMDQVMALENGGDDYITKPFHPDVVMAKIRSQLRRAYGEYANTQQERIVQLANMKLYPERYEFQVEENTISLTKNETHIIELLMERYPKIAGREDILEKLWDDQTYVDENTLNVNMTRVRKKFIEFGMMDAVQTVRGAGYRLNISLGNDLS